MTVQNAPFSFCHGEETLEVEDGGLDIPEMGVLAYPEGIIAADPSAPLPAMLLQHTATREAAAA